MSGRSFPFLQPLGMLLLRPFEAGLDQVDFRFGVLIPLFYFF
jgi:hypothetical protein